jgi:hypothetical protein
MSEIPPNIEQSQAGETTFFVTMNDLHVRIYDLSECVATRYFVLNQSRLRQFPGEFRPILNQREN